MAERKSEINSSSSLAIAGFALLAIVLLIAFFANRGEDVGRIQNLAGNLGGGPLFGFDGFRDSLIGVVTAVFILFSWFGLGGVVAHFIKVEKSVGHSQLLEIVRNTAIGAEVWSLIWFFLGLAGAYSGPVAVVATVIGLMLAALGFRNIRAAQTKDSTSKSSSFFDNVLLGLIAISVALAFVASLAPPTAKDTLLYHLAVPKAFIAQCGNAFIDGNIASYLALGTEMQNVWAMLLGGFVSQRGAEEAAGATMFLFFPLLLIAIFGWSREAGISRAWSLIVTLMFATVPTAFYDASSGYTDVALAFFVTLAIYALCQWWKSTETGHLVLIATFLGAALAIKLTTVFIIAAFALVILLKARDAKEAAGKVVAGGFAALVFAGAIASPWYLRTGHATGSPVFPFYMSIWKGEAGGWDVERSNLFQAMNSQYGGSDKNALSYLIAPWNLSVTAQPEQPEHFDGVLGIAFLFGLPILIWGLWKFELPIEAKIGAGVGAIMFLFWLFSSQQLRYLLPILPVLSLSIAASGEAIAKGKDGMRQVWQYGFAASAVTGILVLAAWLGQKAPLRVALGGETRDQYLTRNLDYYPYYQMINGETAADARVWLINMRRDTYNINRPVFSDYLFEDWTLRKMVWESRNVQELRAKAAAMNVRYVLARYDYLFDYDKSTLVDDQKLRPENEAKIRMAKEFILDQSRTVKADNKFSLIKVF